jgi:hypothetical protein
MLFEPLAEGDDRRSAIEGALQRLPEEQREVLALKIWGEQTFEQDRREPGRVAQHGGLALPVRAGKRCVANFPLCSVHD